ncbi:MAG: tol-pal system protein YbgF [Candidatus Contendobacter sp.]|nr:tol-pal system protein YbgF [Candidatus Contendobacter sp.]
MVKYGFSWLMALLGGVLLSGVVHAQDPPANELTLELLERVEQLETEVRQIRGELELQRHQLETFTRERAAPGYSAYPPPAAPPVAPPAAPPVAPPTAPSIPKPSADARSQPAPVQPTASSAPPPSAVNTERAEFDAALGELREGRYPEAVAAWRRFLGAHPSGDLAGDAQYWLGEACYLSRDYNAAKEAFIALGLNHPQNARLPDALLKLGYIYGEQGDTARARDVLQKLVQVYPNTQAASLAERRLQSLR